MKILAIDSSTSVMGVAVTDNDKLLAETITNLKLNHSVRLMPAIEQILKEVSLSSSDLDRIAVAKGPGSYTGVRIGVSIAKTLAWSLQKELVGVSTLACLAQNGHFFDGLLAPFFDARRDRVYAGLYKKVNGKIIEVRPDQIVSFTRWLEHLLEQNEPVLFLGQDMNAFRERIEQQLGSMATFAPFTLNLPKPSELARLATELSPVPAIHHFVPEYLQMAEAEAKWQANQKNL